MSARPKLIWIIPEERGGIRTYSDLLWPAVREQVLEAGFETLEPIMGLPDPRQVSRLGPDLVHVQHEFGLFGSKIPGLYRFPRWVNSLRRKLPGARIVATAHTVLERSYLYPWRGRGWQTVPRAIANSTLVPWMRRAWLEKTWGRLDGVIVHSDLQRQAVLSAGCPWVETIPHFVPEAKSQAGLSREGGRVLVFGYFSHEKGQDIAILAWSKLGESSVKLLLAGGPRRPEDQSYFEQCLRLIEKLGLKDRVEVTGFVADSMLDSLYAQSLLVVAPFRETSGSGSLVQAMARKAAVLASDLPLNREIAGREAGSLEFFRSGDAEDLARKVEELLADSKRREGLAAAAGRYAEHHSTGKVARMHLEFYQHARSREGRS